MSAESLIKKVDPNFHVERTITKLPSGATVEIVGDFPEPSPEYTNVSGYIDASGERHRYNSNTALKRRR